MREVKCVNVWRVTSFVGGVFFFFSHALVWY